VPAAALAFHVQEMLAAAAAADDQEGAPASDSNEQSAPLTRNMCGRGVSRSCSRLVGPP
jgi:hypothetical protein